MTDDDAVRGPVEGKERLEEGGRQEPNSLRKSGRGSFYQTLLSSLPSSFRKKKTSSMPLLVDHVPLESIPLQALEEYYAIFKSIDADGSGGVTQDEMKEAFIRMAVDIEEEDLDAILEAMDSNSDGDIDFNEFASVLHAVIIERSDVQNPATYAAYGEQEDLTQWQRIRTQTWDIMDDPSSSHLAAWVSIWIMFLIALSTVTFVIETFPSIQTSKESTAALRGIEIFVVVNFTIELLVRLAVCPAPASFFFDMLNVVDLLAILPFYLELILLSAGGGGGGNVLRTLRLVRVFRVMKLSRYVTWLKVFANTLRMSSAPLGMILFIILIALVFCSSLIYFMETINHEPSASFSSIPASLWWACQTLFTVGYGPPDVPQTGGGKIVASLTALLGVIIIAIPVSIISSNYNFEIRKIENSNRVMTSEKELLAAAENPDGARTESGHVMHWTHPFLDSALEAILRSRSRLMSSMKQEELRTRDDLLSEMVEFAEDLKFDDRAIAVVRRNSIALPE